MHHFHYQDGQLFCENVPLADLAERFGTPLYVYSQRTITDHFQRLDQAMGDLDHMVCYAVKANSNLAVLRVLAEAGAGFDIVSGGELFRVLKAGGRADRCTFAGVGKTRAEIEYALRQGIYCFNAESEAELAAINEVADKLGLVAPVALRVNPNVDARTHKYISTGKSENKFGIDFDKVAEVYERAARLPNLRLRGLQMHIGSQLTEVGPFEEAVRKVSPLAAHLKARHGIEFFSVGGGIGIVYRGSLASGDESWWESRPEGEGPLTLEAYASRLRPELRDLGLRILLEPGRLIVGNAGVLVTRVLYTKKGSAKTFQIVDAGMGDLIRPALYQGHHEVAPLRQPVGEARETVDVVGPICETGDFFHQDASLPPLAAGDLVALLSAGAYGFAMASNYNSRPLPAEVLVHGGEARLVRERQSWDDLVRGENL